MLQSKAWLTSISNFDTHLIGRFRNDFGGLGTGSIDDLLKILDAMNVVAPEIQFTLDFSYTSNGKELQILDTKWLVPQQYDAHHEIMRYKVGLDIHFKDTDTHRMLDPDNCHDQHTCRGNIISSAIRIRSIVDDEFLPATARKYKAYLITCNYDPFAVNSIFNHYMVMTKDECLKIWNPRYSKRSLNSFMNHKSEYIETETDLLITLHTYHPSQQDEECVAIIHLTTNHTYDVTELLLPLHAHAQAQNIVQLNQPGLFIVYNTT
eukprot:138494_1